MAHKGKQSQGKIIDETYHISESLYSLLGSISLLFSSSFLCKSKVDRTDAAASVRVEWAMCLPGQTLPDNVRGREMNEWKE
jgi:hypothetical protein